MTEAIRKVIENVVPFLLESVRSRRAVTVLHWTLTAVLGFWFLQNGLIYGLVVIGFPVALIVVTGRTGLAAVNRAFLGVALVCALVPAVFLGKYQDQPEYESITGLPLVGFLIFLGWVSTYPLMLSLADAGHHLSQIPEDRRPKSLSKEDRDPETLRRLLLVKLALATVGMIIVGGTYLVALSVLGLLRRRRWTAALAVVASLLSGFFSEMYFVWEFDALGVVAGLIAAGLWIEAYNNPLWDARARREFV